MSAGTGSIVTDRTLAALLVILGCAIAEVGEPAAGKQKVSPVGVSWRASRPLAAGVELWSRGRRARALELFREAVRQQPRDPIAWHNLGVALASFKEYDGAKVAFRHEWFHSSLAPSAWFGMGWCHLALDELPQAENAFIMAVIQAPREWQYWQALAESMKRQGKTEAARGAAKRAAELKPRPEKRRWAPMAHTKAILKLKFPKVTTRR